MKRIETEGAARLSWDGLDDAGHPVATGVHFVRLVRSDGTSTAGARFVIVR